MLLNKPLNIKRSDNRIKEVQGENPEDYHICVH